MKSKLIVVGFALILGLCLYFNKNNSTLRDFPFENIEALGSGESGTGDCQYSGNLKCSASGSSNYSYYSW